jgi:hypothetical protein
MDCAHHERLWSDLRESTLMCNNTNAISVAKNPVFHKRMKHLEVRHHFLRDHVENGDIEMRYIDTKRQLVDIFTKPLDASCFAALQWEISICYPYGLIWGELVFYLVYFVSFCFSFAFPSCSPKLTLLHLLY